MTRIFGIRAFRKALGVHVGPTSRAADVPTTLRTARHWGRGIVTSVVTAFVLTGVLVFATGCGGPTTPAPVVPPVPAPIVVDPTTGLVDAARATMSWIVVGIIVAFVLNGLAQFWIHRE